MRQSGFFCGAFLRCGCVFCLIPRIGKHQLDTVFLIDLCRAGVIVDGNDVDVGDPLLDRLHHSLAADVIGETPEGLGADDVVHAAVGKLQHLGGEQPALAHLRAVMDASLHQGRRVREGRGGA